MPTQTPPSSPPPPAPPPPATDWPALHGSDFQGKRALITGGAGFIGSHLTRALLDLGATVTVYDDLSSGTPDNLPQGHPNLRFICATITDADTLTASAATGHDVLFHQAALGSVPRSLEVPELYIKTNILGTLNVLQAARSSGIPRVVFAASSSAYGDSPTLPKIESMPPLPVSPYAASKVAGEALMSAWSRSFGLTAVSLRYFNIFGPRQSAHNAYAAVIAAFSDAIIKGQRPVIFGDGLQSRDFTPVSCAVHANLLAALAPAQDVAGQVFNVATGTSTKLIDLAASIARLAGRPDLRPIHKPPRAGDVLHSLADLSLSAQHLHYNPIETFEHALADTFGWYQSQSKSK